MRSACGARKCASRWRRGRRFREGEYYQSDLVGCEVVERASGELVGQVKGWQDCGGPALLEIDGVDGKEILVPFAGSICVEIDTAARRIRGGFARRVEGH